MSCVLHGNMPGLRKIKHFYFGFIMFLFAVGQGQASALNTKFSLGNEVHNCQGKWN